MPPRADGAGVYGGRDALHIAVSEDEGKTWRGFREIYLDHRRNDNPAKNGDRGTAYPLAAYTNDGRIVVLAGQGKGGRNQELALSAALSMDGLPDVLLLALATDGTDGPTDAAGAVVDGETISLACRRGWDVYAVLSDNNSYPCLDDIGALLRLGPTGTNVNDVLILLVG